MTCRDCAYHRDRAIGLDETFAKIRRRQAYTLVESRVKAELAQSDLTAARELVDALASELAALKTERLR